jgi:hypothetical protein
VPSQTADPVRVAIVLPPLVVADYDSAGYRQAQFSFRKTIRQLAEAPLETYAAFAAAMSVAGASDPASAPRANAVFG